MKTPDPLPVGLISPQRSIPFDLCFQVVIAINQAEPQSFSLSLEVLDLGGGDHQEQPLDRLVMIGARLGHEIVFDFSPAVVGFEGPMLGGELPLQFGQTGIHDGEGHARAIVVDGDFDQLAVEEPHFESIGITAGQFPPIGIDAENANFRRLSGDGDVDVELPLTRPIDQRFRRITPFQIEGRGEHRLGMKPRRNQQNEPQKDRTHAGTMKLNPRKNKRRGVRCGAVLLEVVYAMTALSALSLILFKLSLNVTAPRQWVIQQAFGDAYLTYEKALAQRYPFNELLEADSPWPAYPQNAEETVVLGKLPGGREVQGRIIRTRIPHDNNYPIEGGSGTLETNPAGMQVWNVQSILVYQITGREYAESRTVVRSQ